MEKEIMVLFKVSPDELEAIYYFEEKDWGLAHKLLYSLNNSLKDDGEYPRVYYTTVVVSEGKQNDKYII